MTYSQQPYPSYDQQPVPGAEPPVGEPMFDCGFGKSLKRFFSGYVKFDGRASRAEFWWAYLWQNILMLIPMGIYIVGAFTTMAVVMNSAINNSTSSPTMGIELMLGMVAWIIPLLLVSLAILLPSYSIMWRRLHDAGFAGPLALLSLVGLSIVPLIMCILPTSHNALQYGPGAVPAGPQPYMPEQAYGQNYQQGYQQHPYGNQYPPQ